MATNNFGSDNVTAGNSGGGGGEGEGTAGYQPPPQNNAPPAYNPNMDSPNPLLGPDDNVNHNYTTGGQQGPSQTISPPNMVAGSAYAPAYINNPNQSQIQAQQQPQQSQQLQQQQQQQQGLQLVPVIFAPQQTTVTGIQNPNANVNYVNMALNNPNNSNAIQMQSIQMTNSNGQVTVNQAPIGMGTGTQIASIHFRKKERETMMCSYVGIIIICIAIEIARIVYQGVDQLSVISSYYYDYEYRFGISSVDYDGPYDSSVNSVTTTANYDDLCDAYDYDYYYEDSGWCTLEDKGFWWKVLSNDIGWIPCLGLIVSAIFGVMSKYCCNSDSSSSSSSNSSSCSCNRKKATSRGSSFAFMGIILSVCMTCIWSLDNPAMQEELDICDNNNCEYEYGSTFWCEVGIAAAYFVCTLLFSCKE